jgi:uncharacterized protein (TIGR03437 family)
MKYALSVVGLLLTPALQVLAQSPSWDTSGNGLLKGAFNFRQVHFETGDDAGNFSKAIAVWGSVIFDGAGNYSLSNASVLDSSVGSVRTLTFNGTYAISRSGLGFMDSPALSGALMFGSVAQGIFLASSTEDQVNDLFIAVQAPATAPTTASFTGQYWIAEMNFPNLTASRARDAMFSINANGQGGLGTINATGYTGASGSATTQAVTGATYSFSAGAGTINYGTSGTVISGARNLYVSPDGNFIFGGSTSGWDMFAGVRAVASPPPQNLLNDLYYQAGLDQDNSTLTSDGFVTLDTYYGAFKAVNGNIIGHQRLLTGFDQFAFDYTYSDTVTLGTDGGHDDFLGFHNVLGAGGAIRIGFGTETYLGLHVAVKAPSFTGTGVFLNPVGVLNAASYSPFTVGVSRGELIRLYGTNLASSALRDTTFPKTLGNVQVLINNRPAPILVVSPTEVDVVTPWATSESVVAIQVINNGTASNVVTVFRAAATPGIFTSTQDGLGIAAALRPNFSVITSSNPARPGETVALYMTGLGEVAPAISDGTPGPSNPLSKTTNDAAVRLRGRDAAVTYSGLAPQFIGLYQMNVTIPADTPSGNAYINVGIGDGLNSQVLLPISGANADAPQSVTSLGREESRRSLRHPLSIRANKGGASPRKAAVRAQLPE